MKKTVSFNLKIREKLKFIFICICFMIGFLESLFLYAVFI